MTKKPDQIVDNPGIMPYTTNVGAPAIQKDNIYGAQFHPEKSHKFGMKLFKNFAKI